MLYKTIMDMTQVRQAEWEPLKTFPNSLHPKDHLVLSGVDPADLDGAEIRRHLKKGKLNCITVVTSGSTYVINGSNSTGFTTWRVPESD